MRRFTVIIIVILSIVSEISNLIINSNDFKKVKMFSNALHYIIRDYYVKNRIEFDILAADVDAWKFAENVIQNMSPSLRLTPVNISFIDGAQMKHINLTSSTIIFVNTTDFFVHHQNKIKIINIDYKKVRHFAVIGYVGGIDMGTEVNKAVHVTNLLVHNKKKNAIGLRQLVTECEADGKRSSVFEVVNEFWPENMTWKSDIFELNEPMQNLMGCNFRVKCNSCFSHNHNQRIFLLEILTILEESLNFNALIVQGDKNFTNYTFVFDVGALGASYYYNFFPYETMEWTLIFSIGEPYTPFEKIIPFDMGTWIALGVTFLIGFITIMALRMCSCEIQMFVFGTSVNAPAFNIVIAFFGQGQNILPRRNFSRYLLTLFVLFCLIIRTCYQGVQFELIYKVGCDT